MAFLFTAFVLTAAALLAVIIWSVVSLNRNQIRGKRIPRWAVVAGLTLLVATFDLSDVLGGAKVRMQNVVPPECRASFDRDYDYAPGQQNVTPSFTWDTTKCPNSKYLTTTIANDAVGNVGTAMQVVSVLNLGRIPILGFETQTKIYPGGGYVELISSDQKKRTFGLSDETFRFSWSIVSQNNEAWVVELGILRSIRPAPRGSILRLSVRDGTVTYLRNGVLFYTSPRLMTAPSKVQVDVQDSDTLLGLLTIAGGSK